MDTYKGESKYFYSKKYKCFYEIKYIQIQRGT